MPEDELRQELRSIDSRLEKLEINYESLMDLLRGKDSDSGLIGRVQLMWRSYIGIISFISLIVGYALKAVVDKL